MLVIASMINDTNAHTPLFSTSNVVLLSKITFDVGDLYMTIIRWRSLGLYHKII